MKVKSFNDEKNEFEGEAYFGITDMAKDKQKAEKEKFTKKHCEFEAIIRNRKPSKYLGASKGPF